MGSILMAFGMIYAIACIMALVSLVVILLTDENTRKQSTLKNNIIFWFILSIVWIIPAMFGSALPESHITKTIVTDKYCSYNDQVLNYYITDVQENQYIVSREDYSLISIGIEYRMRVSKSLFQEWAGRPPVADDIATPEECECCKENT